MAPMRHLLAIPVLLAAGAAAAPAAAEATACTAIASLPAKITVPGRYCLARDFVAAFATHPIILGSNDVVLDCNGHRIEHTGSNDKLVGVLAENRRGNVVRNCALVGLYRGVELRETAAGASRDNRVIGNEIRRVTYEGISIEGSANLVQDNRITEILGLPDIGATGIAVWSFDGRGAGNEIRDNLILGFDAPMAVSPIVLGGVNNTVLAGNIVAGVQEHGDQLANGMESWNAFAQAAIDNILLGDQHEFTTQMHTWGISFGAAPPPGGQNVCARNVVGGYTYAIVPANDPTFGVGCVTSQNTTY